MKAVLALVVLAGVLAVGSAAPLWGPDGHSITAMVAASFLQGNAASQVSSILNGASMASVASWADQVKSQPQWSWSYSYHFINTPSWVCNFDHARDCGDDACVAGAIQNYTTRLGSSSGDDQAVALKFLIHFVGDIHQPLHCGFTDDKGGNTIEGTFNGHNDNLHAIWDTYVIKERMSNDFSGDSAYAQYLVSQINGAWRANATNWATCGSNECADDWGNESTGLACQYSYRDDTGAKVQDGFSFGQSYYNYASPVIDMQLAKGGVRLSTILNKVLGGSSSLPSNK